MKLTIYQLLERINREKPNSVQLSPSDVKEWVVEALRKIESKKVFTEETIESVVKDGQILLPRHAVYLRTIISEFGIMQESDSLEHDTNNVSKYFINGRSAHVDLADGTKVELVCMVLPVDSFNNPYIKDDEYLISALISYVLYKKTKKMWMSDQISERKYREFESDWLYYVQSASSSLEMPSEDSMRGWTFLHDPMSSHKDEIVTQKQSTSGGRYTTRVIISDTGSK